MHRVAEAEDDLRHCIRMKCIGQTLISIFCLEGPYASKICWEVVIEEPWCVCIRRGLTGNCKILFMTACVMECICCICNILLKRPSFLQDIDTNHSNTCP